MATRRFLFMTTEGYQEEQAATDDVQLGKVVLSGVGGVAIDAGSARIIGVPTTPTADTDAVNKAYVDSVASGLEPKDAVEAVKTGGNVTPLSGLATTVDTVPLDTDGMRVLLTAQTDAKENGIWVVHSGAWTRPVDFAVGSDAHAAFVLAISGAAWLGSGWVCTNAAGAGIVGTNNLTFVQFSAAVTVTASTGLEMVGSDVRVKKGDGIEVTSNSGATNIDLATDPGLALTGTSPNKKLAWKPDNARGLAMDATGAYAKVGAGTNPGLQFLSGGDAGKIDLKLDGSGGLTTNASGEAIKLNGALPGIALAAGGASVTSAPKVDALKTASGGISAGDAVYPSGNNLVSTGSNSADSTAHVIGVVPAAILDTAQGEMVSHGQCPGVLSGATVNTPYYLGAAGGPVLIGAVGASKRVVQLGFAMNATDLWVAIKDFGKKAA
jgi:hypothetical protein